MKSARILVALMFGVGMTLIQFVAVGALNEANVALKGTAVSQKTTTPLIVTPPPETRKAPPRTPDTLRTRTSKPTASINRVRTSALAPLNTQYSKLGLGSSLPDIGGVGLGGFDVPEVPTEPDRPARARRTIDPQYPISARRDGIEGYVTVRLSIGPSGRVKDVIVVDSEPIGVFEQSAREAARRFEFVPARVDGEAVTTTVEKTIVFRLQ